MKNLKNITSLILLATVCVSSIAKGFKNFKVAVYCRGYEVAEMGDPDTEEVKEIYTGEVLEGTLRIAPEFRGIKFGENYFMVEMEIRPHSFRAFSIK